MNVPICATAHYIIFYNIRWITSTFCSAPWWSVERPRTIGRTRACRRRPPVSGCTASRCPPGKLRTWACSARRPCNVSGWCAPTWAGRRGRGVCASRAWPSCTGPTARAAGWSASRPAPTWVGKTAYNMYIVYGRVGSFPPDDMWGERGVTLRRWWVFRDETLCERLSSVVVTYRVYRVIHSKHTQYHLLCR